MRKLLLFHALLVCVFAAKANPGDTIKVQTHNAVHMNGYGSFDRKAKFPAASKSFNMVLMHYTLGCPASGCSEWDYTTQVLLRKPTGKNDSTLLQTPNFKVDGNNPPDTLRYKSTITYNYFFNSTTKAIDSVANDTLTITLYADSLKPLQATSTVFGWKADYYKPVYDSTGAKTDSVLVAADATLIRKNWSYYNVFEIIEDYELGRVITPYNGNVANNWKYTYTFDVTDFITLLRDSVEIRAFYSGYQDGFTITLDFEMIEGTPARECYQVVNLWSGSHSYGDPNNSIENFIAPRNIPVDAQMKQARLRIIQTGHGFGGSDGCAEFCPKEQFVKINGQQRFQKTVWRDNCGLNPIYPQGGTWVYNRANWCPGAEVHPYDYDITPYITAGNTAAIDMDMEAYTNQGNNFCSYTISGMLFLYKDNAFATDASVEEIMAPSNNLRHARYNPICDYPQVRVQNNGSDTIKTIEFSYGPQGGTRNTHTWSGTIAPHQSADAALGNINFTQSNPTGVFEVEITKVNGKTDEVAFNNLKRSAYSNNTPVYPNQFIVWLRTNNRPQENSYTIKNQYGQVVHSRAGMSAATLYTDTITLINNCYTFELKDDGGDGLSFWADPNAGSGQLYFRRATNGQVLKSFGADFGSSVIYNFTVGYSLGVNELGDKEAVNVYPNPGTGQFWVDFNLPATENATVKVMDYNGRVILENTLNKDSFAARKINLENYADGFYLLQVETPEGIYTKKIVKAE